MFDGVSNGASHRGYLPRGPGAGKASDGPGEDPRATSATNFYPLTSSFIERPLLGQPAQGGTARMWPVRALARTVGYLIKRSAISLGSRHRPLCAACRPACAT